MSSGQRMPRSAATININLVRGMLNCGIEKIEICGSYRIGKSTIGDVDLVVQTEDNLIFLDHMDSLVERELLNRGKNAAGKQSWGEKKRLIEFRGMNFDIETANRFNFGYKHWLRTGPSEANTLLMGLLSRNQSRVRMDDGYLWHVTYHTNYVSSRERKEAQKGERGYHKLGRLKVPDEETFFMLLGMPYLPPEKRDEIIYRRYLGRGVNAPEPEALKTWYLTPEEEESLAANGIKQQQLF